MARASVIQNQFTRGELSPRMRGRIDLAQYYQGCRTMQNWLPLSHGGATVRPGLRYVAATKDADEASRLLSFVFNVSDTYALELADKAMRVFRERGQVVAGETDAAIVNGDFAAGIAGWTDNSTGAASIAHDAGNQRLQLNGNGSDVAVAEQAVTTSQTGTEHVLRLRVVGAGASGAIKLRVGSSSGGEQYLADSTLLDGYHCIQFTPDASPFYLQFRNEENGSHGIDDVALLDDAPVEIDTPYAAADLFALKTVQDADTMWLVHADYKPQQLTRSGHASWSLTPYLPASDPFTADGDYPAAVAFFEQRLVFGYSVNHPQRLWFSRSANVQDMTTGTGDSDGFTKDIFARQANPIRWVVGGTDLVVGTTGGVWVVERPASSPVTVSNFTIKRRITAGADDRDPAEVDNRVLYIERRGNSTRRGRELRDMRFDDAESQFIAAHLSLVSDHVIDAGVQEMAWQEQGWSGSYQGTDLEAIDRVLWCVRGDGVLASFTYDPQELVSAWARQVSDGAFESVAVIPGADGDEVWCVVQRTVDGNTVRYVEFFDPDLFLDSALTGSAGSPQATWSGLEHLEGKTVGILADGSPAGSQTVAGGSITLNVAASEVQIGLAFTPELELMPLELALEDGTSIGAPKSVARVVLRFLNTVGIQATASGRTAGIEIPFRQVSDDVAQPIPPFSGDKELPAPTSWSDATVKIIQPNPLPATILAVAMEMEANR